MEERERERESLRPETFQHYFDPFFPVCFTIIQIPTVCTTTTTIELIQLSSNLQINASCGNTFPLPV